MKKGDKMESLAETMLKEHMKVTKAILKPKKLNVMYQIFVEGSLVNEVKSKQKMFKLRSKFESEGWNVKVIELHETIIGFLGKEIL